MKGSLYLMKRAYSSVALVMVAVSAMAAQGGADSPLPASRPPYREPPGDAPEPGYDPFPLLPAFSGCTGTREALKVSQQALAAERSITGQFGALMEIKIEQSRRYIAALDDLKAVRGKLDECEVTRGTAGASPPPAAIPDGIIPPHAGKPGLAGDLSKAPDILPNERIAYPDCASQIRALRAENRSLQSGLAAKDDQLTASQAEIERLVARAAELEARVKEMGDMTPEDAGQHAPLPVADPGGRSVASGLNAPVEQQPLPVPAEDGLPSGDYASGVAFSQEVLRAIETNSALGILTDKKALTAGFSDNMSDAVKYSTSALLTAMSEKQKEGKRHIRPVITHFFSRRHITGLKICKTP